MIKAIVFDAYGTIISTGTGSVDAAQKILATACINDISLQDFYAEWKQYHRKHMNMACQAAVSLEYQISDRFLTEEKIFILDLARLYEKYGVRRNPESDIHFMLDMLGKRRAFPESRTVLQKLAEKYIVCVGSNTDTFPLICDMRNNHLSADMVFTSELLKCYKPNALFYDTISDNLKIEPCDILFVGDSIDDDVKGPQEAGMKTCWINRKHIKDSDILPDMEIYNLEELLNYVILCE